MQRIWSVSKVIIGRALIHERTDMVPDVAGDTPKKDCALQVFLGGFPTGLLVGFKRTFQFKKLRHDRLLMVKGFDLG